MMFEDILCEQSLFNTMYKYYIGSEIVADHTKDGKIGNMIGIYYDTQSVWLVMEQPIRLYAAVRHYSKLIIIIIIIIIFVLKSNIQTSSVGSVQLWEHKSGITS